MGYVWRNAGEIVKFSISNADEKLGYLYRFIIVFIVISVLGVLSIKLFIEPQSDRTLETAMDSMATNMSERSLLIHNIWLSSGKDKLMYPPSWLNLYNGIEEKELGFNPKKLRFVISLNGWPMNVLGIDDDEKSCENLWRGILGKKLRLFIEEVRVVHKPDKEICIFNTSVSSFIYNYNNGSVVKLTNNM